jgi:hypothetical protein
LIRDKNPKSSSQKASFFDEHGQMVEDSGESAPNPQLFSFFSKKRACWELFALLLALYGNLLNTKP